MAEVVRRDYSYSHAMECSLIPLTTIGLLAVACRLYIRWRKAGLGFDDLAIFMAGCCTVLGCVGIYMFTDHGVGTHIWDLTLEQREHATHWLVIAIFQSYINLFFLRLSIGLFLLRMLVDNTPHRWLRYIVFLCLALNLSVTVSLVTLVGNWCRPLHAIWRPSPGAQCMSAARVNMGVQVLVACSAATDALYGTLPIAIFWRLNMPLKRKLNLMIIMSLVLVICACAIGKAVTVNIASPDFTWVNGVSTIWATLEIDLGLVVACLPGLRQFWVSLCQNFSQLRSRRNSARSPVAEESKPTPKPGNMDIAVAMSLHSHGRTPGIMSYATQSGQFTMITGGDSIFGDEYATAKNRTISIKHDIDVEESVNDSNDDFGSPSEWSEPWAKRPSDASHHAYAESFSAPESHRPSIV